MAEAYFQVGLTDIPGQLLIMEKLGIEPVFAQLIEDLAAFSRQLLASDNFPVVR